MELCPVACGINCGINFKKETARATMRKMVKRLLKKYKYPPEQYENAIETVIGQCEMWTDNVEV